MNLSYTLKLKEKCIKDNCYVLTSSYTQMCRSHRHLLRTVKIAETQAIWYQKHKEQHRSYRLKYKYGITRQDYNKILSQQHHVCKICKRPDFRQELAVDHNHKTGQIRGLLCENCNRALGLAKEDTFILRGMIKYLLEHKYEKTTKNSRN